MNSVDLNFLPIHPNDFEFEVFRKPVESVQRAPSSELYQCRLPVGAGRKYDHFLVSFNKRQSYESFICKSRKTNVRLSLRFIQQLLLQRLTNGDHAIEYEVDADRINQPINFIISHHAEGERIIYLQPYFLASTNKLGFLINFRFRKAHDQLFTREVQKLSLSLDKSYRANTRFYTDKFHLLRNFINETLPRLFPLTAPDLSLGLNAAFEPLPALQLERKTYLFSHGKTSPSQFMGLKQHGPYHDLKRRTHYVFLFEKRFRNFANDIYLGLLGKKYGGTFSGIRELFKMNMQVADVTQVSLDVYTPNALNKAFAEVQRVQGDQNSKSIIGVFIAPKEEITVGESTAYYYLKHLFAGAGIPLQVVNYEHMSNANTLKWSLANISLQMFAKLGGTPWLVQPRNEKCLIVGMGSAHKRDADGKIQKYFGYSVCLDSSGLFKKINVLAYEADKTRYLQLLRDELKSTILTDLEKTYRKCVLHLPFKIRRDEIQTIRESIREVSASTNIEFRVIKVNTENKFFGFSPHNTRIPYESTYVRLSRDEYLSWFEGLQYGKENVHSKVGSPVHLQFLREENESNEDDEAYLQDVINLSGANWRGFNSKLVPISIYYSSLIAGFAKEFEEFEDMQTIKSEISDIKSPWFL